MSIVIDDVYLWYSLSRCIQINHEVNCVNMLRHIIVYKQKSLVYQLHASFNQLHAFVNRLHIMLSFINSYFIIQLLAFA